jgi:hypothetical protein
VLVEEVYGVVADVILLWAVAIMFCVVVVVGMAPPRVNHRINKSG